MDYELYLDTDKTFCYGTSPYDEKFFDNKRIVEMDDYAFPRLNDSHSSWVMIIKKDEKLGIFTLYRPNIFKANKCPFIDDEMWISCSWEAADDTGYIAFRIGKNWGILRIIDPRANDVVDLLYDNSNVTHTTVVPCIYKSRIDAIEILEELGKRDYHKEYGWENYFEPIEPLKYKRKRYTPDQINSLKENEIFVYGSNLQGFNGGGAAKYAQDHFGAKHGVGVGRNGQCYAIPTMDGSVNAIKPYVDDFIKYAAEHKDLEFLLTPIGCGIAGYTPKQIAPLFKEGLKYGNIVFPKSFIDILIND